MFLAADGYAALEHAKIETPVVSIPAFVSDEDGNLYPVKKICANAFIKANKLKHLILSEGVEYLEGSVFAHCGSLMTVVFPSSLKVFQYIFWNCPTFEQNAGGLLYYAGTQEQWEVLKNSYPDRHMMGKASGYPNWKKRLCA